MSNLKSKSNLYYLLPAFGSIIGGLIAMIILRKQGRQYDKLGRNCVVLGIIASGFAIGMDYVNNTYDIPMIEDILYTCFSLAKDINFGYSLSQLK